LCGPEGGPAKKGDKMKSLPFWFIAVGAVLALLGMAWGIQMAISQDHSLAPGHAHNNLVGYVTMVIYGIYYKLVPAAATTRLAMIHFWVALVGGLTIGVGVALATSGQGEVLAQIASIATIIGMAIFVYTVFRNRAALTV
jgi:cbb3-type cytochrome oxidase subunit 1